MPTTCKNIQTECNVNRQEEDSQYNNSWTTLITRSKAANACHNTDFNSVTRLLMLQDKIYSHKHDQHRNNAVQRKSINTEHNWYRTESQSTNQ